MATYTKNFLSQSVNGKAILLTGTTTSTSATIHVGPTGTTIMDEVWLYVMNTSTSQVKVTIEYGSASAPNDNIIALVNGQVGLFLMVPGLLINNGLKIQAFAATGSVITITGYVNRIQ